MNKYLKIMLIDFFYNVGAPVLAGVVLILGLTIVFGIIGLIICLFGFMPVGLEGIRVAGAESFIIFLVGIILSILIIGAKRSCYDYFKELPERIRLKY